METLILIKPSFVRVGVLTYTINKIKQTKGLEIKECRCVQYSLDAAKKHYIAKANTDYYDELTSYLSSGEAVGIVVSGNNAIVEGMRLKKELREEIPTLYDVKTDKMRNIIHSSDSKITAEEEIKVFRNLGGL